jgi:hypothetical protein
MFLAKSSKNGSILVYLESVQHLKQIVMNARVLPWLISLLCWLVAACNTGQEYAPEYRVIWEKGRYGYIDREGEVVLAPQFDYAMPFSDGLGGVNVGGNARDGYLPQDGKWGFVDISGRFVINPKYYSPPDVGAPYDPDLLARAQHEAYIFSEGLAAVRTEDRWIYIDKTDSVVIGNLPIEVPRRFREGLANVFVGGRWGYINRQGQYIIPPQFLYPADFHEGKALVVNEDRRRYLIDHSGNPVLPQYRITSPFYHGIASAQPGFRGAKAPSNTRTYTLVDSTGKYLFEPEFDRIGRWGNDMAPVLVGSKAGDPISYPQEVEATEELGGRWGFVNAKGRLVVNPRYQGLKGFKEGYAAVKSGGLWAYLDEDFNRITDYEFRWVDYFHNGIAEVRLGPVHGDYDGRYAYINTKGDIIWIEPN